MRACEAFNISFGEKVYGIEVFNDSSTDLIAVGLKNSIVIYQITFDEAEDKFRHNVIQAVSLVFRWCNLTMLTVVILDQS